MRLLTVLMLLTLVLPAPAVRGEEDAGKVDVRDVFAGKVTKWKARRIHLEYDLTDKKSLEDFSETNPFLASRTGGFAVEEEGLVAKGTGALLHQAVFEADVQITLTVVSKTMNDIGVALIPPSGSEKFLLFSIADTYFSLRDRQTPRQHMITVVGAGDGGPPGDTDFRYLNRSRTPALEPGKPIEVEILKRGDRNRFVVAGANLDAADRYGTFPEVQPALFTLESGMTVTALRIDGRITTGWLEKRKIAWDPKEEDDEALPEIDVPDGPAARVPDRDEPRRPGYDPGDRSEASALIRTLRDAGASEENREKAAEGLTKDNVKLDQLRALIDCLVDDDLTTRTLAFSVLKRVTGKTLGYHPKAPEKARGEAFRKWFQYMRDNRERFVD